MHAWESIQKTLDYIEANLAAEHRVEDLAAIAALSVFYYQRLFARLVKKPVREYIKLRRLAHACSKIRSGVRFADIAEEYGFGARETFSRAFKDVYGISPSTYRNRTVSLSNFDKPDLVLAYTFVDEGVPLISDGIVIEMSRKMLEVPVNFIGIEGYMRFEYGKMLGERPGVSEPGVIWDALFDSMPKIPHLPCGRKTGVCYKGNAPDGFTTYFAGVEVAADAVCDLTFVNWQLPAREYVVCGFEAESESELLDIALGKAMKYTRFWLKQHGLIADGFFPEIYYASTVELAFMELWIPFRERNENKTLGGN